MGLTGTPIENGRPVELYNLINFINPTIFPDKWKYIWEFCDPKNDGFGWNFNGCNKANIPKLHSRLIGTIMLRRLKKDVLLELPEKIRTYVPIELTNQEEYNFAEKDFISWVSETKGNAAVQNALKAEALIKIESLKQVAVRGKLKGIIQWITDFLETDNKLVVVTSHTFVIDEILQAFSSNALKLDGSVTGDKRQKVVEAFQNDPSKNLFIMNIRAGGVGITLTAACAELVVELDMNPMKMIQAEDRIHRMTQTRGVTIYYGLAINTIEEKIAKLLDEKTKNVNAIMDGVETEDSSLLHQLMKEYEK